MTTKDDRKNFYAEFEALKAKYGEAFADLSAVRFTPKEEVSRDFVPYSCRRDRETGDIICKKERPV